MYFCSAIQVRGTKAEATMSKAKKNGKNGKTNGGGPHANGDESVMTVTFRIPAALKKKVEQAARTRGVTTTRIVVVALENEVLSMPPRWWANRDLERDQTG